jgi:hypothetical protein
VTIDTEFHGGLPEQILVVGTVRVVAFDTTVVIKNRLVKGDLRKVLYSRMASGTDFKNGALQFLLVPVAVMFVAQPTIFVIERLVIVFPFELLVGVRVAVKTALLILVTLGS